MRIYPYLFLLLVSSACNTSKPATASPEELAKVSLEVRELNEELKPRIEDLIQRRNAINIQGRALTTAEIEFSDKVNLLESAYNDWKENHTGAAPAQSADPRKLLMAQVNAREELLNIQQLVEALETGF